MSVSMLCIAGCGSGIAVDSASEIRDSGDDASSDAGGFSDGGLSATISTDGALASAACSIGLELSMGVSGVSVFILEPAGVGGSGSDSRFIWLQCGQCQFRDLFLKCQMFDQQCMSVATYRAASLFLSVEGYSMEPTPTAACPFSGKKPWSPMMASTGKSGKRRHKENNRAHTCPHAPRRLPEFLVVYILKISASDINS
jgi:hypothetical protein